MIWHKSDEIPNTDTAQCYANLFFIVVSFLNFVVLSVMLVFELKRLGIHFSTFADKKILIFFILAFMQLCKSQCLSPFFLANLICVCRDFLPVCFRHRSNSYLLADFRRGLPFPGFLPDDEFFHQNVKQIVETKEVLADHLQNNVANRLADFHYCGAVRGCSCCKTVDN